LTNKVHTMNIYDTQRTFSTKKKCIAYLEKLRWNGKPICPFCASTSITPRKAINRHHCNGCNKDFSVLIGTVFEDTHLPLPKWFLFISLVLNARKGISAKQISRDLKVRYQTAWYCGMRLRCAMVEPINKLQDVVEMDEVYIGGKPQKYRRRKIPYNVAAYSTVTGKTKRGKGADKIKVVGVASRGTDGRVFTKMVESLSARDLLAVLKRYVAEDKTVLMTDENPTYKKFDDIITRHSVNHRKGEYVRGNVHTNTIEGFWSIVKNGIRGQYHVLSKKYLPFYLAEFSYKYNRRNKKNVFEETLKRCVCDDKCTIYYKPIKEVRKIAYPRKKASCGIGSVEARTIEQVALELYAEILASELAQLPSFENFNHETVLK
jgi:transposase-like protein